MKSNVTEKHSLSYQIDDQISLLINAWCELLVFSCCYRSMDTPGVIRVSNQKKFTLEAARELGIEKWIEKMLHFSDQLRRLKIDCFEYVSMKVIVLLTSGMYRLSLKPYYYHQIPEINPGMIHEMIFWKLHIQASTELRSLIDASNES